MKHGPSKRPRRANRLPRLMLLDLDMPRLDGFGVLEWVRDSARFRQLPIIVLTQSTYSGDVTRAYQAGANSFLVKSADFNDFRYAMRQTLEFWFVRCKMPETLSEEAPVVNGNTPASVGAGGAARERSSGEGP